MQLRASSSSSRAINPNVPDAVELLDQVAEAGYAGIDLGPAGYLGLGDELHERLSSRGLGLAGGYLELPYTDHAGAQGGDRPGSE